MNPTPDSTPLTPDDPRVTAYALGEMSAQEKSAFESEMGANPAVLAAVEDIRAFSSKLESVLEDEPLEAPSKRGHLPARSFWGFPHAYYFIGFAAAAALAVFIESRPPKTVYEKPSRVVVHEVDLTGFQVDDSEALAGGSRKEAAEAAPAALAPSSSDRSAFAVDRSLVSEEASKALAASTWALHSLPAKGSPALPLATMGLAGGGGSRVEYSGGIDLRPALGAHPFNFDQVAGRLAGPMDAAEALRAFEGPGSAFVAPEGFTLEERGAVVDLRDRPWLPDGLGTTRMGAIVKKGLAELTEPGRAAAAAEADTVDSLVHDGASEAFSTTEGPARVSAYSRFEELDHALLAGTLPRAGSVRLPSFVNSVTYGYPLARPGEPLGITLEAAPEPWDPSRVLVRIGLRALDTRSARAVTVRLTFDSDVYASAAVWGEPPRASLIQGSLQFSEGLLPRGRERTILVELVRRDLRPGRIGRLAASAHEASMPPDAVVGLSVNAGAARFADTSAGYQLCASLFRLGDLLNRRPADGAAAFLQVEALALAIPGEPGPAARLSACARKAAVLVEDPALTGFGRRLPFGAQRNRAL